LLRRLFIGNQERGGLLDAFPVYAALAFVLHRLRRDRAGDAGINRLEAPKVELFSRALRFQALDLASRTCRMHRA
jgi:hypothetical protein